MVTSSHLNAEIREEYSPHHHRTEIPNIVEDALTDVYERSLYLHMKRRAGDGGHCISSKKNMAEASGMSPRKLVEVKKSLARPRPELGGRPLIRISPRTNEAGDPDTDLIIIVNMWDLNYSKFAGGGASGARGVVHDMHQGGARGAPKEEPFKKNPIKNNTRNSVAVSEKAFGLADLLLTKMKENNPRTKEPSQKVLGNWALEIDRMNRIDGYSWQEIEELIVFSQEDDFWSGNILSGAKLRKQVAQLLLKQKKKRSPQGQTAHEKLALLKENRAAAELWKSANQVPNHRMRIHDDYCEIKVHDEWVKLSFYEYAFEEQIRSNFKKAGL